MALDECRCSDQGFVRLDEHSKVQSTVEGEQEGEKGRGGGVKSEIAKRETRTRAGVSVSILQVT
jgi:hypothetical protein